MDLSIRDARLEDSPHVARLLDQLGYPADKAAVGARLERLAIVGDRVFVAEADGQLVGLAHLQVSPGIERDQPIARLAALVVDDAHRGRGIGRALVQAAEEDARRRGCALLFLTTRETRDDAHAFYERVGFERTGRRYSRTLSE